jgi:hypothetical protein
VEAVETVEQCPRLALDCRLTTVPSAPLPC